MSDMEMFASNAEVIEQFRQRGGKVGGFYEGASLLLLTTVGRRSGKPYTVPLAFQTDGEADGARLYVVAANAGGGKTPDWYYNLVAQPAVTVEVGRETLPAQATIVEGAVRDRILAEGQRAWAEAMEQNPDLPDMPEDEAREYPVIELTVGRGAARI